MTGIIASSQNAKIKLAASLKQKKSRDASGLFLAEGLRLCEEAVRSGYPLEFCLYSKDEGNNGRLKDLLRLLAEMGCPVYEAAKQVYAKASDTKEPQGILLVLRKCLVALEDLPAGGRAPFYAVLDGLQDPGNMGTVVRSADAAGCTGVILMKNTVDLFSPKAVRATMGSLFHLPVVENVGAEELLPFLQRRGVKVFATALDAGAKPYFDVCLSQGAAVVFGNEGNGVREMLLKESDERIFIPMAGRAESLNVATAAAVVLFEGLRQRREAKD